MYKIKKIFTSRDGNLEPDERLYGIDEENLKELGEVKSHLGGANHIFVRVDGGPSNKVIFFTRDNLHRIPREEKSHTGWAEYELNKDATYKPHLGEEGWWNVMVADAPSEIAEGIGLPDSWHVSTFVIFSWDETETGDVPETPEEEGPEIPEEKVIWVEIEIQNKIYAGWLPLKGQG